MAGPDSNLNISSKALLGFLLIGVILALGRLGTQIQLHVLAAIMTFFLVMAVSFVRGTEGLYIIIFAMLFSPEISSGIATGKATGEGSEGVILRLEDIIILAVAGGWMLRSAYTGRRHGIIHTHVNSAIWIYMGASFVATLLGSIRGSVSSFASGIFNNLKYFEYFLLYFMILAHVRTKQAVVRMIWAMLTAFFLVLLYAYTRIGVHTRLTAPFDPGQPNTFGGYIVLLMCVAAGIALADKRVKTRAITLFLLAFAIPPLFLTLSRASYLAFAAAVIMFLVFSQHRILISAILVGAFAAMLLGLPLLPDRVEDRIAVTFQGYREHDENIAGIKLDSSASERIRAYKRAIQSWLDNPLLGNGVTGTHFIDGQYPRLLAETGIVGLSAFGYMIAQLLLSVRRIYRTTEDPFFKGTAMGLICGIAAVLAHALTANSFIIIRIAEPLWLLTGLVLLMPSVTEHAAHEPEDANYYPNPEQTPES
ncbi:MAG: O-antigen ligase family protein [Lentisphaerae bacterium]|nr:O-antigen ligase family protein [Lentisphaerota bacterium]